MLIVGEEGRYQEIKKMTRDMGIDDIVIFTGSVPYTEVPKYMSCMDTCLIALTTSDDCHNCFPLTLLEYMACERPVISTKLRGVMEAVGNRVLYTSNSQEMEGHILRLLHDFEYGQRFGSEGRAFVERNYSWEMMCEKLEKTLIEVQGIE